ncbi:MAG TPA: branched-chain amino acid ABC transporter permease, partial [Acetomicrobium sp.]|nr:branched-chain amino acid ABC transporter permease [Acetomicrobium sp.]
AIPGRVIALFFFIALFCAPFITDDEYFLGIIVLSTIFALFAISWDLLSGFTGQLNLGHALFFGVSAYSAGLLNVHLHYSPWITIPFGAIVAVLVGLVVGIPALRLRGFYLGLVTLTFPLILLGIFFAFPNFTGGELGISGIDRLASSRIAEYYIVAVIFTVSSLLIWKLMDTKNKVIRLGILLHAIREDEITARASGINTTLQKFIAFALSAFFAGIAGGLYAHYMRIAAPSTLELFFSFQAILWTIFGGITTIYGPVVGVFILYPLLELMSAVPWGEQLRYIVFGVVLIATLMIMPEGISVWILDKLEIECPRCKLINAFTRKKCRACRAPLRIK